MRRIFLDTETTGLDHRTGDRVIEIGCVEMLERQRTERHFHAYLNPEREVGAGAIAIHGLTDEFLADKPTFAQVANDLIEFVHGAELVIHNATFDTGFLDNELGLIGKERLETHCAGILDSLKMARNLRPGKKNNLNALCAEFGVDNSARTRHGALRDAELLALVWLAMTQGQETMIFVSGVDAALQQTTSHSRPPLIVIHAADEELRQHERVIAEINNESKGKCVWGTFTATT